MPTNNLSLTLGRGREEEEEEEEDWHEEKETESIRTKCPAHGERTAKMGNRGDREMEG